MRQNTLTLLQSLGVDPDSAPHPGGSYVPVNVRSNIAYVAIQFPIGKDGNYVSGSLGKTVSTDEGYLAAHQTAVNVLSQIEKYIGIENVEGLNHIDIYYRSAENWNDAPKVANGASDLFIKALGPKGIHTRSLIGAHDLPNDFCIGITASFTLH